MSVEFDVDGPLFEDELDIWRRFNDVPPAADSRGFHERLADVAHRYADHEAVSTGEQTLTYAELRAQARHCAAALADLGIRAGEPIGLLADRDITSYVVIYAAVLLGAPYVPLDTGRPVPENLALLRRAGVGVLVGAAEGLAPFTGADGPTCVTPQDLRPGAPVPDTDPGDDHLLYVIHTSGTTGLPKGVCIPRRAMVNLAGWYISRHEVRPGDRLSQNAPLTFDPSAQQMFSAWLSGACLDVLPAHVRLDPYLMADWLGARGITHLDMVTAHWTHLSAALAGTDNALPRLRWTIVAGESMYPPQAEQWLRVAGPRSRLNNIYGPTETTVNATQFEVTATDLTTAGRRGPIPIGTPLPGYRVYLVDDRDELCAPGVPGEIVVAGAGLADGYLNDEVRTAGSFGEIRPQGQAPTRVYRTGDLAELVEIAGGRWVLSFRGRRDRQIKLSGYRVELEAVESAAQRCPGVDKVAVLVQGDPAERLAFVYSGNATPDELRVHLRAVLPGYVVVGAIGAVDTIPVTGSGKTDQNAVRELLATVHTGSRAGTRHTSPVRQAVAEAWAAELGRHDVPVDVPFFGLGGSSLAAFRIVARLRRLDLDLRATDLLGGATVAACADLVEERQSARTPPATTAVDRARTQWTSDRRALGERLDSLWNSVDRDVRDAADDTAAGPLTRAWAAVDRPSTATASILLDFDTRYDPSTVARAVEETAAAHAALRTRRTRSGRGGLETLPAGAPVPVVDVPDEASVEGLRRTIAAAVAQGGGEARAAVAATAAGTSHVLLHLAHPLVDGPALALLTEEIVDRTRGLTPVPVPADGSTAGHNGPTPRPAAWAAFRHADEKLASAAAQHVVPGTHTFTIALPEFPSATASTGWLAAVAARAIGDVLGVAPVPVSVLRSPHTTGPRPVTNLTDAVPLLLDPRPDPLATAIPALAGAEGHCVAQALSSMTTDAAAWGHSELPFVGAVRVQRVADPTELSAPGVRSRLPGPEPAGDWFSVELAGHLTAPIVDVTIANLRSGTADAIERQLTRAASDIRPLEETR